MRTSLTRTLCWTLGAAFVGLSAIVATQYVTCPVYRQPVAQPFAGSTLYNPDRGMERSAWKKANFQVQSYAWLGLTAGAGNSIEMLRAGSALVYLAHPSMRRAYSAAEMQVLSGYDGIEVLSN